MHFSLLSDIRARMGCTFYTTVLFFLGHVNTDQDDCKISFVYCAEIFGKYRYVTTHIIAFTGGGIYPNRLPWEALKTSHGLLGCSG